MAFPAPNTLCRIQSVDFNTCLELYDVGNEAVVLRSVKETELQQWLFIKQRSGNTYKILAAATQAFSAPRYLTLTDVGEESQPRPLAPPTAVKDSSSVTHWHLYKENDGSFIVTTNVENANNEGYLRVSEDGKPDSVEKKAHGRKLVDRGLRWEITEFVSEEPVSPSSRYPEINEREYAIRNIGTGDYWGFIPGFHARAGPLKTKQLTAKLSYVDQGNTFRLSYSNTQWFVRIEGVSLECDYKAAKGAAWVLERHKSSSGGYYYYICLASDRSKVISGETVPGTGKLAAGEQVFKIVNKKLGSSVQQWKFET